ncbi:MAG: carbonic anhydrase [Bacteroidota bacterium]|jgi:carbonic anhydrase
MDNSYKKLIDGNRKYAMEKKHDDPNYFKKLALGQDPQYLWIGCSDSRVPANEVTNTVSGDIFVHRNIANMVVHTDVNLMSVLDYAVNILKVKHVIVCGHYGCGGVKAAMKSESFGYVDSWLRKIKEIYQKYNEELNKIEDFESRANRLCELNVIEQVHDLAKTKIIQEAWKTRKLQIHGWVYGLDDGLIKELNTLIDDINELEPVFHYKNI